MKIQGLKKISRKGAEFAELKAAFSVPLRETLNKPSLKIYFLILAFRAFCLNALPNENLGTVVAGLALLVIPGILLMVLFQYAVPLAILEDQGAINSLKRSYAIGKENFAFSLVLWILLSVIEAVGGLVYIGVLITIPFTALCICIATTKLTAKTEEIVKTEETAKTKKTAK